MDFQSLQNKHSKAFNEHRALVKKVLKGKKVKCGVCNEPLFAQVNSKQKNIEIKCSKGCTDLLLDIDI